MARPEPKVESTDIRTASTSPETDQKERARLQAFLRQGLSRFRIAADAEQKWRNDALDDLDFRVGNQWPKDLETQRNLDHRPCLTMNRLPQFIRQVTNEQRQQRPSIQINPVGDGADIETAEIEQGIIRHIEVNSEAEIAYDTAFDHMVTIGKGWWEISTDYIDDTSFDQEIQILHKKNAFTIYDDPSAIEPTREDSMWRFEVEDIPQSEYRDKFPNSVAASLVDFKSVGDQAADWATKDTIRVAKYWHVEQEQTTLEKEGKTRRILKRKVICTLMNAVEVLNTDEPNYDPKYHGCLWPGLWIPLVPVLGDDLDVNGKQYIAGLVRNSKDPQRMYNYWISAATEMIALAPKAPFVGAVGQFKDLESRWQQANTQNMPYLEYNPISASGQVLPPPARNAVEVPIQTIAAMTKQADYDLKATAGIFDPTLGNQKQDQSGRAINLLQKQSDVANLNFVDNLSRAIRFTGRQILDLIPKIYDVPRVQRIIKPDSTIKQVVVYAGSQFGDAANGMLSDAVQKVYDLGVGRYDVTVTVGPSYQSKRQEAVAGQLALVQDFPAIVPIAGDIIVGNMDWPGAKEISKRLKKTMPPQLQDQDDNSPEAQLQKAQATLQQFVQQHDMLVQQVQKLTQEIQTDALGQQAKVQIAAMNNASEERRTAIQTQAQLLIEAANIQKEAGIAALKGEIEKLSTLVGQFHDHAMIDHQLQADQSMASHQASLQPPPQEASNGAGTNSQ